jgi:hypothetical protein
MNYKKTYNNTYIIGFIGNKSYKVKCLLSNVKIMLSLFTKRIRGDKVMP